MARIVIAGTSEVARIQLSRLLASSGYEIFRICASGGELRRTLSTCEDGVVIFVGMLADAMPDDMATDFENSFQFLLIGRPDVLRACESTRVFKLEYPCSGSAVAGAIEMLTQLHRMQLPKRTEAENALVERAKSYLMRAEGMSEAEAHRHIQQHAMRRNMKMADYAARILEQEN